MAFRSARCSYHARSHAIDEQRAFAEIGMDKVGRGDVLLETLSGRGRGGEIGARSVVRTQAELHPEVAASK